MNLRRSCLCIFVCFAWGQKGISLQSQNVTFGSLVRVKNIATGRWLASGCKSFEDGKFDRMKYFDRRCKQVWLSDNNDYQTLWALKGEHSNDLRWNVKLGSNLVNSGQIRLENLESGCNLSILYNSKHVVAARRISFPIGINDSEDELRVEIVSDDGEIARNQVAENVLSEHKVRLSFVNIQDKNWVLMADDSNGLVVKDSSDLKSGDLEKTLWVFEIFDKDYAKNDEDSLKSAIDSLRNRGEWEEIQGTLASTVSLWQDVDATRFLISAIHNYDFYTYLSTNDDASAINTKIQERMTCIDIANENLLWGTDRFGKIHKAVVKDGVVDRWVETDVKSEFVFAGTENEAYRLSSQGWKLYKTATIDPNIVWERDPVADEVVSASVGLDGSLWWIDVYGNVWRRLDDKVEEIFSHLVPNYPRFVKIDVAGKWDKNYLALLRSDGKTFFRKDNGSLFCPGLLQIIDVAVAAGGKVAVVVRRPNWVTGPIFKSRFVDLVRWNKENSSFKKTQNFNLLDDFLDYFFYQFELAKFEESTLSKVIVDFEFEGQKFLSELKKSSKAKDFFKQYLKPAVQKVGLDRLGRQAMKRLAVEVFEDSATIAEAKGHAENFEVSEIRSKSGSFKTKNKDSDIKHKSSELNKAKNNESNSARKSPKAVVKKVPKTAKMGTKPRLAKLDWRKGSSVLDSSENQDGVS